MEDLTKPIPGAEPAAVVTTPETPLEPSAEVQRLKEVEAELAKTREERDNYRTGLLAAKGRTPQAEEPEETVAEFIERKVEEKILGIKEAGLQQEKDQAIKQLMKENEEYRIALGNRQQVATPTGGAGSDTKSAPEPSFWSPQQLAELQRRGLDPNKVRDNFLATQ